MFDAIRCIMLTGFYVGTLNLELACKSCLTPSTMRDWLGAPVKAAKAYSLVTLRAILILRLSSKTWRAS